MNLRTVVILGALALVVGLAVKYGVESVKLVTGSKKSVGMAPAAAVSRAPAGASSVVSVASKPAGPAPVEEVRVYGLTRQGRWFCLHTSDGTDIVQGMPDKRGWAERLVWLGSRGFVMYRGDDGKPSRVNVYFQSDREPALSLGRETVLPPVTVGPAEVAPKDLPVTGVEREAMGAAARLSAPRRLGGGL